MPSARLTLREEDVVRLALEFLHNRELHISQLSLERETGVINGCYSDDLLFLRQLILDGQWDDVLEFIQPLEALPTFEIKKFTYTILKHKYVELLCIKSEAGQGSSVDNAVEEVVKVLNELEKFAPTKEDYSNMCLLLTLPRLTDHLQYKDWNPSNARVKCFREVYPLAADFLPGDRKSGDQVVAAVSAKNDRLIQLIIKGILYESCVNYCQAKATGTKESQTQEMNFSKLLDGSVGFSDSDLSLLSWLQSIPSETFSVPFEQRTLNVDVERLERPSLETSWTEHMLVTPIKPKTFPHSAMPFTRPRSAADIMSRSLLPALDGLPFGLAHSTNIATNDNPRLMAFSACDINSNKSMSSSSFASFHLTGIKNNKAMNTSVDRLFENENDVSLSYPEFQQLSSIQEQSSTPKNNTSLHNPVRQRIKISEVKLSTASTPDDRGRESPSSVGTARSSRRDSLNERPISDNVSTPQSDPALEQSFSGDLLKEFQKQKQKLQETLALRGKEREELIRQLSRDNRIIDEIKQPINISQNGTPSLNRNLPSPRPNQNGNFDSTRLNTKVDQDVKAAKEGSYDSVKVKGPELDTVDDSAGNRPRFVAVTTLEDVQAVRCAEFHPGGLLYAVGSNSKTLRICGYPKLDDVREDHQTYQPMVLFKRTKHHKGSIYCLAWSPVGDLMATGSNDKTVKLMKFNEETSNLEGDEIELSMHDGTVRDLCFLEDTSNKSSLLISGGAGDCKIYVTDCTTGTPFQALSGHTGHILSLYTWGGAMFVSGSHDKTVRFWDLRTRGCVSMVTPCTVPGTRQGSPVASLCVDPSGRLLVSGHEDTSCVLYDIRGGRSVQTFKPHSADVRSIRFSPSAYYLLTGGYDNKLVLTDLQGDLTLPLPSVVVAQHQDKVISGRWHPSEFSFLSTSADKTATLWALPPV
ncbi:hypothetical protein FQR65_LT10448 [Abscondita terminalis]|nr:hypothetical protein FQR65_LT10448 [Abscondita terminalis]